MIDKILNIFRNELKCESINQTSGKHNFTVKGNYRNCLVTIQKTVTGSINLKPMITVTDGTSDYKVSLSHKMTANIDTFSLIDGLVDLVSNDIQEIENIKNL